MIKTYYLQEYSIESTCEPGSKGNDVRRIQEWLCLNAFRFPEAATTTAVDAQFGPATQRAVRNLQKAMGESQTGVVTPQFFGKMIAPLANAFTTPPVAPAHTIRETVLTIARTHLQQRATELQTAEAQNLGPWVRSYCDGYEGSPFKWCMGFAQSVLDLAATAHDREYTAIMPKSLSCDVVAMAGQQNGRLIQNDIIRKTPDKAKPGDLFLIRYANVLDWFHTGIITEVDGDVFETIEGNTDIKGSSNGTAVFSRVRNFRKAVIDVFSIDDL